MKKIIIGSVIALASILAPQIIHAQGTTYLSNLGQPSDGSNAVGSDSWLASLFYTGTDSSGYTLNSIQLGMADASGNPSGFTALLYSAIITPAGWQPFQNLCTFSGSLNPTTAGIYTFTPASNVTLSRTTGYFIVLTAGTTVANGAYDWSYVGANSYNPSDSWSSAGGVWTSSNGSSWSSPSAGNPQFAINATAIPEPGVLGLLGLGGLAFLWHRRKAKAV